MTSGGTVMRISFGFIRMLASTLDDGRTSVMRRAEAGFRALHGADDYAEVSAAAAADYFETLADRLDDADCAILALLIVMAGDSRVIE